MAQRAEHEIFDCLESNLRLAAEHCEDLAKLPRKGPSYHSFRTELKLVEQSCRDIAFYREHANWLAVGMHMARAHIVAGDWLRGIKQPDGSRRRIAEGQRHPLFMKLAENLRAAHASALKLKTRRTNRVGIIVPPPLPSPHRDTRPVHITVPMHLRASGLIVPSTAV